MTTGFVLGCLVPYWVNDGMLNNIHKVHDASVNGQDLEKLARVSTEILKRTWFTKLIAV